MSPCTVIRLSAYLGILHLSPPEQEFERGASVRNRARWIQAVPGDDITQPAPEDDSSFAIGDEVQNNGVSVGHGTCMASLAAGYEFGVAKRANVVVVRHPRYRRQGSPPRSDHFLAGVQAAVDDRIQRGGGPAVALMALYFPRVAPGRGSFLFPDPTNDKIDNSALWARTLRNVMVDLVAQGVLPVVGAGNTGVSGAEKMHLPPPRL